jgi:hypothetical protein
MRALAKDRRIEAVRREAARFERDLRTAFNEWNEADSVEARDTADDHIDAAFEARERREEADRERFGWSGEFA